MLAQMCGAAFGQETLQPASFKPYKPPQVEIRVSEFSGKAVPRYASLRYDEVNGRQGPGMEFGLAWKYKRRGLPVIVIRETQGWWKVRDPQGDEVWVRQGQLANEHTVIAKVDGAILKRANAKAAELVTFQAGAVMSFKGCSDGWCRVEAQGREGYVIDRLVWGADELPAN